MSITKNWPYKVCMPSPITKSNLRRSLLSKYSLTHSLTLAKHHKDRTQSLIWIPTYIPIVLTPDTRTSTAVMFPSGVCTTLKLITEFVIYRHRQWDYLSLLSFQSLPLDSQSLKVYNQPITHCSIRQHLQPTYNQLVL